MEERNQRTVLDEVMALVAITEMEGSEHGVIYRGVSSMDAEQLGHRLPSDFYEVSIWRDECYRVVWTSDEYFLFVTYCEHDAIIQVCPDREAYHAAWHKANAFYYEMEVSTQSV